MLVGACPVTTHSVTRPRQAFTPVPEVLDLPVAGSHDDANLRTAQTGELRGTSASGAPPHCGTTSRWHRRHGRKLLKSELSLWSEKGKGRHV
jgi:hypothetical protein